MQVRPSFTEEARQLSMPQAVIARLQKNPSFPVTFKTLARITGVLLMHESGNTVYDRPGI
jgi:hypothetical protein